jgi:hypothetical protein
MLVLQVGLGKLAGGAKEKRLNVILSAPALSREKAIDNPGSTLRSSPY